MSGIFEINRSYENRHLMASAYLNCMALGLCFLMPWTPDFAGYQLPIGLMGFDTVSEYTGGESDKVVSTGMKLVAMLVYLFPLFLVVSAALATVIVRSDTVSPAVEKTFAFSVLFSGLFPVVCLITVIAFFGHKGFYGDLGLYFAVFVGLAAIWQLTGIGKKDAKGPGVS